MKCEVRGVRGAVRGVKKVFAWRCIAPGPRAGHALGQQQRNRFAQSTHARTREAGARRMQVLQTIHEKRFYSTTLRQLPPRRTGMLFITQMGAGLSRFCSQYYHCTVEMVGVAGVAFGD